MASHVDCIIEIHSLPLDGKDKPLVDCYTVRVSEKGELPRVLGPYRKVWEAYNTLTREGVREVHFVPTVDLREI